MALSGLEVDRIQQSILSAFNEADLEQLLNLELNEHLANIVAVGAFRETVHDLILWCDRNDRTNDLLRALCKYRPSRAEFQDLLSQIGNPKDTDEQEIGDQRSSVFDWTVFSDACHDFMRNRLYVLVVGRDNALQDLSWAPIARLPLSMVLDFDPDTQEGGALHQTEQELRNSRSLHLWSLANLATVAPVMQPEKACYWFAARGLRDMASTLVEDNWRMWSRAYVLNIQRMVEMLMRSSSGRPITVISLWDSIDYLREVCAAFDRFCGESTDFVFVGENGGALEALAAQFNATLVRADNRFILHGIERHIPQIAMAAPHTYGIPKFVSETEAKASGALAVIGKADLNWLQEDLTVLHSRLEQDTEQEVSDGSSFLKGATITWSELADNVDAPRDMTASFEQAIKAELRKRSNRRMNLYHWPGSGGTTLARRIAWNLRGHFPTVLLHRIVPSETAERFRRIFAISGLPILVIMEGADLAPDVVESLYKELDGEHLPVVFLNVIRRLQRPTSSERSVFLSQVLSNPECDRFLHVFARAVPSQRISLKSLAQSQGAPRTPIQFALTAFGRDYEGLPRYVRLRLEGASRLQREVLTFSALAYYYGHKPLAAQLFAERLGVAPNRAVRLETGLLDQAQLELLIQEELGFWRPAHHAIAEEILVTSLGGAGERRNWRHNLVDWASQFIILCEAKHSSPNEYLRDLLRRVVIMRNESEVLGADSTDSEFSYSALIRDIQTDEGRLSILQQLVKSYPNEPHFWGHLGRFYSITMQEPQLAIEAIDKAIAFWPRDPVLHHMKGMAYRKIVERVTDGRERALDFDHGRLLIEADVSQALKAFAISRQLDPQTEYGCIAPLQMLLHVLDFGYDTSGKRTRTAFLAQRTPTGSWYREVLDQAEGLMEEVRRIYHNRTLSNMAAECQAHIDQQYDDYQRALAGWHDLLERVDVYAPPVRRQIVRVYLMHAERRWENLPAKQIENIVGLLEDNLREEPNSENNLRLWFRAIRYLPHMSIDVAIDRIANWKAASETPDAYYYHYILHVLKALDGSMIECYRAADLIGQSRARTQNMPNRSWAHEWFGSGRGLRRLVNSSELGGWDANAGFYTDVSRLTRLRGRVAEIRGPAAGYLELEETGLRAFFVPSAKREVEVFSRSHDENVSVQFYLGFAYEGLRAWDVSRLDQRA